MTEVFEVPDGYSFVRTISSGGIVGLKEFVSMDNMKVIVMELGDQSLADIVKDYTSRQILIPRDVCDLLFMMHKDSSGATAHGDVKMENILLFPGGHFKHYFSIAKLLESSHIQIQSSTLDFGRDFTPFVADGGSVTLVDIVLKGRAPIPELMDSSTPGTHLIMSKCVVQDVIVGLSPIFGPSSYSVEVSLSVFANIDHAVPLLYSPSLPALHTSYIPSLETYSTILASSTMVNVTDDIYGTITNAPIFGKSFLFRDVLSEQQTVKSDVLSTNAKSNETMAIKTDTNFKVKKTQFVNTRDIHNVGVAGLFITATEDAKVTISSCSFDYLISAETAELLVRTPNSEHFIRLIMKKCEFFGCTATHITSATLGESTIEMDKVHWEKCEGRDGIVFLTGRSAYIFSSSGGIELRSYGFQYCKSDSSRSNMACLWISYAGPVLLHKQTTFNACSSTFSNALISTTLVFIRETRFVECWSTDGRAGGCTVRGYQVTLENVLILFIDRNLLKVLETDERQKYEMRKCIIEPSPDIANPFPDVAFAMPESTLVFGNLNATRFEDVFTTAERNTVSMTTSDIGSSWSKDTFHDQTAIMSKQGDDPRKDRRKADSLRKEKKGLNANLGTHAIVRNVRCRCADILLLGMGTMHTELAAMPATAVQRMTVTCAVIV
ncbi:hypothetical protein BLNAU_18020 [Blattamonas nauphoetae]|uniref:Protein kinase domain-containing protein n=1 Tax=Blattamonas nauphoetae TaxID=2049346 RepID=A0ABQ9X5H3_9EUKA|nr:hypothetical protein BLNAU_18020 [Blattamonas nauphoetae]